jgi:hypothetical protein
MRFVTLATCLLMASAGTALAANNGANSDTVSQPTQSNAGPMQKSQMPASNRISPSGRPSAILSRGECQAVWKQATKATKQGDSKGLTRAESQPYVVNFSAVDKDNSGSIQKSEFKQGCKNGWIQASDHHGVTNPGQQKDKNNNNDNNQG